MCLNRQTTNIVWCHSAQPLIIGTTCTQHNWHYYWHYYQERYNRVLATIVRYYFYYQSINQYLFRNCTYISHLHTYYVNTLRPLLLKLNKTNPNAGYVPFKSHYQYTVFVTFYRFVLHSRRRAKRYRVNNCHRREREQSFDEWARTSLREKQHPETQTTPTQTQPTRYSDYRPRLGIISESPEDRLADLQSKGHVIKMEDMFSPDDSVLGNNNFELSVMSGNHIPYFHQSPGYYPSSSHSHPNLMVSAQAPFSPYRLTWISPSPLDPRVVKSEPNILETSVMKCQLHSVDSSNHGASYYQSTSWTKSPYNPNHNTPISSDGDSNNIPANTVINRTQSGNNTPTPAGSLTDVDTSQKDIEKKNEEALPEPIQSLKGLASRGQQTGSDLGCCGKACDVVMWSYMAPPVYPVDASHLPPQVYARMMQERTCTARNAEITPGCEQCQACIVSANNSMCPNVGSSNPSVCNYGYYNNSSGPAHHSYNTSVCGHVDSYEMTQYSNTTGPHSYNASGYNAGPSHSTSIAGHMSSRNLSHDHSLSSSRDESHASIPNVSSVPLAKEMLSIGCHGVGDSTTSVLPVDTTTSNDSANTSADTTTNSSHRLSTTVHSTRSAPAAYGTHNNSTWGGQQRRQHHAWEQHRSG